MGTQSNKRTVICVASQKGGVGKSTTAAAIAGYIYAEQGSPALVIDLDPQGNLTYSAGCAPAKVSALDVLAGKASIEAALGHMEGTDYPMTVVPSTPDLSQADRVLAVRGGESKLRKALDSMKQSYEYIVIDTPPALGRLTIAALTAADYVVIPAQADVYSVQGVAQLMQTIAAVRQHSNPGLQIAGILLTRFNARSVISKDMASTLEALAAQYGTRVFATRIRESVALKEAQAVKADIFKYSPRSGGAVDYKRFGAELLNTITKE